MEMPTRSIEELVEENESLRARLEVAEETVRAIRSEEVDALIVGASGSERVCTLGNNEGYLRFVEVMGQGALTVSLDGTILYCNRHFAEMIGSTADKLLGISVFDFVPTDEQGFFRATIWDAHAGGIAKRQLALRRSAGPAIPVAVTATAMADAHNSVCLLLQDLSDHEARLAAEAANAAKSHFLAQLSHELRTPLTPIILALDNMLASAALTDDVREDLQMIHRNIGLETRLIDDLLDVSRVATGKLRLETKPVSVHALVHHVLEMLLPDLRAKSLHVQHDLSATADVLSADAARLQQILWNLLRNAIQFTDENRSISIRSFNGPNQEIVVEIADQGMGIPPEMLSRIFGAFEQGVQPVSRRSGGLGLGLAIVKALVEAHGGTIAAHSQGAGLGACFTLKFPHARAASESAPRSPASGAHRAARQRILLVEDHADTARAIAKLLTIMGHTVTVAGSIAAVLQLNLDNAFDLVISDIGLPDGTGHQLLKEIRKHSQIPAIALTGFGMAADVHESALAGFNEHVTKPFDVSRLESLISRVTTTPHA